MTLNIIFAAVLFVILLSLQSGAARVASQVLQPFVKMMLRFCMPPFLFRFMMQ